MRHRYRGDCVHLAMELDKRFFEKRDVEVIAHQPWQFGLFHKNLQGKFVWYPHKGTLMYEANKQTRKVGLFFSHEEVYEQIMKKINEQLPEGW